MHFIDFHVHIDFYDDPIKIIEEYERAQIYALFVTNLPEIFEKHFLNYNNYKYVRLAVGYHPELVQNYDFNEGLFCKYIKYTNYIGEVGLDFTLNAPNLKKKQLDAFNYICNSIKNQPKILSIHSKKAEKDVINILVKNNIKFAVFHWYTGSIRLIDEIIKYGYYFSININMLNSKNGKNILNKIPPDRILFETDGPFTRLNKKIVTPNTIEAIYTQFNEFYGIDNFKDVVYKNFRTLLFQRSDFDN